MLVRRLAGDMAYERRGDRNFLTVTISRSTATP